MPDSKTTPPAAVPPAGNKTKDRSPNYPAIGLRRALELTQKLWDSDKRQPVLSQRAAMNMGFTAKSSAGMLALAAMRKYGLLEADGSGDQRKVKLTETAITLLNPSAGNREPLLKEAALKPAIHAELWGKYGSDGASPGAIHDYLVFERKFTEQAATVLIDQYKDTIAFAKLGDSDKVQDTQAGQTPQPNVTPNPATDPTKHPPYTPPKGALSPSAERQTLPPMTGNIRYLPIPLDIGDAPIPVGMSDSDFELLLETLKLWKKKIVRAVGDELPVSIDVSQYETTDDGDYILPEVEDDADYKDRKLKLHIRSIGRRKTDGVILASTSEKFYENPDFECLWLR